MLQIKNLIIAFALVCSTLSVANAAQSQCDSACDDNVNLQLATSKFVSAGSLIICDADFKTLTAYQASMRMHARMMVPLQMSTASSLAPSCYLLKL